MFNMIVNVYTKFFFIHILIDVKIMIACKF